jgi:hypothetical protein
MWGTAFVRVSNNYSLSCEFFRLDEKSHGTDWKNLFMKPGGRQREKCV